MKAIKKSTLPTLSEKGDAVMYDDFDRPESTILKKQ